MLTLRIPFDRADEEDRELPFDQMLEARALNFDRMEFPSDIKTVVVKVGFNYYPSEPPSYWDPGCDACVEWVCAYVDVNDMVRDVSHIVTPEYLDDYFTAEALEMGEQDGWD